MYELLWLACGAVVGIVAARRWPRRRTADTTGPVAPPPPATTEATPQLPVDEPAAATPAQPLPNVAVDTRQLVCTVADEVANLASGVEGRAHLLVEAAVDRSQLPAAAEALLEEVRRLRTLHGKLLAFGHARPVEPGATALHELLPSLVDDLQAMQLGLELRRDSTSQLPSIAAGPTTVRDALLFLFAAMLRAERGATHLAIDAEPCLLGEATAVQIQLALEWRTEALPQPGDLATDPSYALDIEAARHLITHHGGRLRLAHLPGRSVRAIVRWPAAHQQPAKSAPSSAGASAAHHYGGALVLESDPAVRAMLSRELKATGRAVFACADGASARSFLEATPDRFELLILDHQDRLDSGDALGATIRTVAPDLKIFVLTPSPAVPPRDWPRLHHIQKPFGVHELRAALASVLAAG